MRRLLTVVFASLVLAPFLSGCDNQCSSDIVSSAIAANGQTVRLDKKNCGATTGYVYEVKTVDPKGGEHVVLRFDSDHSRWTWPEDDRRLLRMRWIDQSHLAVNLYVPVQVFKMEEDVKGVQVRYHFKRGTIGL
jgi:hypothetical protein